MVRILLFAALKDIVGKGSVDIPTPSGKSLTPRTIWESLLQQYPGLVRYEESVRVAVNRNLVAEEVPVSDGDEVAFFPPVSGGGHWY